MDGLVVDSPGHDLVGQDGVRIKEEADTDQVDGTFQGIDWAAQEQQDDDDINRMFNNDGGRLQMPENLDKFGDKEIDQTDKAADAIDFEDISDDDLASDDEISSHAAGAGMSQIPGLTEDEGTSHDTEYMDDLFGGEPEGENNYVTSSPPGGDAAVEQPTTLAMPDKNPMTRSRDVTDEAWKNMTFEERQRLNFPQYNSSIDRWMNQMSKEDASVQKAPENVEELLAQRFPGFAEHKTLYFNQLFPEWPAEYMYKEPANKDRDPPEFVPTKLDLELEADSSKLFKIPENVLAAQRASYADEDDWSNAAGAQVCDATDGFSDDSDTEDSPVGGFRLDEIATICDDWGSASFVQPLADDEEMDDWDREFLQMRIKKSRPKFKPGLPDISSLDTWGVGNFRKETLLSSKRVRLDVDDPYLLIDNGEDEADDDQLERPSKRPKVEEKMKRMSNGQLRRDVMHHFNLSNDDAYDALKANHKSKVRATLSNLSVEHSMPALKLAFPFYRTKVEGKPWEHHRKKFEIEKVAKRVVGIRKPSKVRRKDTKGRSNQEIFRTTKDLSLNDNSTAVLFEYCEQFPVMMSNFGMGSRVINYHRRKDRNDEDKIPKLDIGEGHPLLPEDRSPFSIFGTVEPGETVPTLHNEMYRAPIFKHEPRSNDFLLGYTTNATEGPRFYLRKIDHVYTVGQIFPSLEVPGPHARKVTNTSKNRLKMIAYRMMKKKDSQDVGLNEITPHVFEKPDPQNRQKMKEFLLYDRDKKTWVLPEGQTLMDESVIRSMIKPEDACLIEAMQVGQQLLANAGYDPKDKDEDDEGAEEPLVAKMAPWELTKNFIDASAGKAMVALHGEGDPTGHGLGFSFIKTSMKGGYINAVQGPLATSADAIERERKANGGHSYNVKKQQDMYNTAIRQIWERQKTTLSDPTTHDDADVLDTANEDDRFNSRQPDATPIPLDDGRSQFSRLSAASRSGRRKLKITRKKKNENGEVTTETVVLDDPVVIRNYLKQRREIEEKNRDVYSLQPTADADENREKQKLVDRELSRLLKNQDRRQIREKQGKNKKKSALPPDASPDPSSSGDKMLAGTTRKCANCGQVGHIKTNKSKCPLLNGTITTSNNAADHGGFGSFGAPSSVAQSSATE
ncbi:hypothetical protein GGS23DRAFT_554557 [Durotheca rogersii]|uniref:uncharacterized protein n=1 Tax=Durotheca rogersii TaxID=419775 RepID=UPI002220EFEF|nr:uncharacterized protein GGS23DRAFT_554557 [Durotheca rogersii]KAI5865909.1 hypothetical protein GGS23DRAFT_554557 [Durotheca rogersii]